MLNTYKRVVKILINGEYFDTIPSFNITILNEDEAAEKIKKYTWADLKKEHILVGSEGKQLASYQSRRNKGRLRFKNVCEWEEQIFKEEKETDLTITLCYFWEETKCSLNTILSYRDSEKAIQYLIERGITAIQGLR